MTSFYKEERKLYKLEIIYNLFWFKNFFKISNTDEIYEKIKKLKLLLILNLGNRSRWMPQYGLNIIPLSTDVLHCIHTADFHFETFLKMSEIYVEDPITGGSTTAFVVFIISLDN